MLRQDKIIFASLSLAALVFASVLALEHADLFQRYFGAAHSSLAVALAVTVGGLSLWVLQAQGDFRVFRAERSKPALRLIAQVAMGFAALAVLSDLTIGYGDDLNVAGPPALLFYPVMGFVVEALFHLLPLAVLVSLMRWAFGSWPLERVILIACGFAASLEPALQVGFSVTAASPLGLTLFIGLHVAAFNLFELYLFRRYDFVSMYVFRLIYYLLWHIMWGTVRLL